MKIYFYCCTKSKSFIHVRILYYPYIECSTVSYKVESNLLTGHRFEQIIVGTVPDNEGLGLGVLRHELLGGHRAVLDINVARTRPRHHVTGIRPPTSLR